MWENLASPQSNRIGGIGASPFFRFHKAFALSMSSLAIVEYACCCFRYRTIRTKAARFDFSPASFSESSRWVSVKVSFFSSWSSPFFSLSLSSSSSFFSSFSAFSLSFSFFSSSSFLFFSFFFFRFLNLFLPFLPFPLTCALSLATLPFFLRPNISTDRLEGSHRP